MASIYSEQYRLLIALLAEARARAELTQQQVATKLRRPQSFVSKYENGERSLDPVEFLQVCRALGADPYKILRKVERV